jgi:WD40 repeat protein
MFARKWFAAAALAALASSALAEEQAGPLVTLAKHANPVQVVAFTPGGNLAVSVCPREVRFWDPATGAEQRVLKGLGSDILPGQQAFAISPDCKRLAIAGRERLTIHDLETGKEVRSIAANPEWDGKFPFRPAIAAVAFSADGSRLATAGSVAKVGGPHGYSGGMVAVWDSATGENLHRFENLSTSASSVAFSGDGKTIVAGTNGAGGELPEPAELWVWNLKNARTIRKVQARSHANPGEFISAADVAVSPDGKQIAAAVGSDSRGKPAGLLVPDEPAEVRVWDVASGEVVQNLAGHLSGIRKVAFSPDGKRLASGGTDGSVRFWDLSTGKQLRSFPFDVASIDAIAFSPDGKRLIAGGGIKGKPGEVRVWAVGDSPM